jgi:hypothetical protein
MSKSVLMAGLISFGTMLPAQAEAQQWNTLATVRVLPGRDSETMNVRAGQRTFREIRLCAGERGARITELRVDFVRGRQQRISIQRLVRAHTCDRANSLRTQDAAIRSIRLDHGRPNSPGIRPTIIVQAR